MKTHALAIKSYIREETIFWGLVSLLFASVALYGYFVNLTIFNVADRMKTQSEITRLNSELGAMEFDYLSLKRSVTMEKALSMGFTEVQDTVFVSHDDTAKSLSLNKR
jgi:hypothetical protein